MFFEVAYLTFYDILISRSASLAPLFQYAYITDHTWNTPYIIATLPTPNFSSRIRSTKFSIKRINEKLLSMRNTSLQIQRVRVV